MSQPPRSAAQQLSPPTGIIPAPVACASASYAALLAERDCLRGEATEQRDRIAALEKQLAVSEYRRLSVEIAAAVATGDRERWSRAVTARLATGLSDAEAFDADAATEAK